MSDSEEYISAEDLITSLERLIVSIKNKRYSRGKLQDIFDSIEEFLTGKEKNLDPEALKYLIRGWWLTENVNKTKNFPESICPYCLKTI